jgi:hypothetical protein
MGDLGGEATVLLKGTARGCRLPRKL